jgi:hypothetical protein
MLVQEAKKAPKLTLSKVVTSLINLRPSISIMQRAGRKRKQRAIKSKETNSKDQISTPNTPSSNSSQNSTPSKQNTRRNTLI